MVESLECTAVYLHVLHAERPAGQILAPSPTLQWRPASARTNMSACDEFSDEQIANSTYGLLLTCAAADKSGLCAHGQIAGACPVHCGLCGTKPPAWGTMQLAVLNIVLPPKNVLSLGCSNMRRPEQKFHDQLCKAELPNSSPTGNIQLCFGRV